MTPYRRGNRDGLLSAAAEYDAKADAIMEEVRKWQPRIDANPRRYAMFDMVERWKADAQTRRGVAARLRLLAEALPEDPEGSDDSR